MPIDDIQQFIEKLEKAGELKRVKTEVDASLEIAEILRRVSYAKGPAVLFENVMGYDIPVLGNAFGSIKSCLLYTSPSPRDVEESRMPSSA